MPKKGETGSRGLQEVTHATPKGRTVANAANSDASLWHAVANAHAVLASSCGMKSPMHRCAAVANAANNDSSFWLAVANAHAVLARACGMKSPMHRCAAVANAANKDASC